MGDIPDFQLRNDYGSIRFVRQSVYEQLLGCPASLVNSATSVAYTEISIGFPSCVWSRSGNTIKLNKKNYNNYKEVCGGLFS